MSSSTWRVASASATGSAHLRQNTECQDRLAWRSLATAHGETLIAVIADGAGSTSHGQEGAEIACRIFLEQAAEFLSAAGGSVRSMNYSFGRHWIGYFHARIREAAAAAGKEPREFASTLVAAVTGHDGAAFFQVGDGAIVVSGSGGAGSYSFALAPHEAEYVNVTDFITDEDAAEKLRFGFTETVPEDLILFSDGIFPVAVDYRSQSPHEPFLIPMIAPLRNGAHSNGNGTLDEKLRAFLSSPGINERSDDDKSIILASRAGS